MTIALSSENAWLNRALRQRYQAFLSDHRAHFQIDIVWYKIASQSSFETPGITFQNGEVSLSGPAFSGSSDLSKRQARLSIEGSDPVKAVDYFLRVILAVLIFDIEGILVHGAGILHHGCGYLFYGHSGSGKTTVSRLSVDDVVLNDDLVVLMPQEQTWSMYSTPFWNPTQVIPQPHVAPLTAMYQLIQDHSVFLESYKPGQAVAEFVSSIPIVSVNPAQSMKLVERCIKILDRVPAYRLHFLPDDSFWQVVNG